MLNERDCKGTDALSRLIYLRKQYFLHNKFVVYKKMKHTLAYCGTGTLLSKTSRGLCTGRAAPEGALVSHYWLGLHQHAQNPRFQILLGGNKILERQC